jgi:signal transduction histidine kinase
MLYVGDLEQKYNDMRSRAVMIYLSAIFAGMTLTFIIFLIISRGILHPLRQLSEATKQISEGDLSYRVDRVSTGDELGELAGAFNIMAEQLEIQHSEIDAKQETLVGVNEELRQTNKNYMELLGFVTHELKNPLSSAILGLHTVKDGYLGELNQGQKKSLDTVSHSLDYFHDMIRNYLDLSRLEKGEIEVRRSQSDLLRDILTPIIEGLEREITEKNMSLETHVPQSLMIEADRDLLRIVFDNLLANALKYGRESGLIIIAAKQDDAGTVISVFNEGAGVSAEKLPLLFRKFSRIDDLSNLGKKGTGLGLFICREIIEKHGGKISAESIPGSWIRFTCSIPH